MLKFFTSIFLFLILSSGYSQEKSILKTYNKKELLEDYDLLVSSLKEAHPGLYWYTSYSEYEIIFKRNRKLIKDGMNSYEFYRIISRIVSADKEGHSQAYRSSNISEYVKKEAKFLPFAIMINDKKLYFINDVGKNKTKGQILKKINNVPIDTIISEIFIHKSRHSDGYSLTGQYKNLDYFNFSTSYNYYIDDIENDTLPIELFCPKTKKNLKINIPLIIRDSLINILKINPYPKREYEDKLYNLELKSNLHTAILTFNNFNYGRYEKKNLNFTSIVDSVFNIIRENKIKNLIIDVRNNGGGSEGAEDYLFSYLTTKIYKKYEYVQANAFEYSFFDEADTNYKGLEDRKELYEMLKKEHFLSTDGRILRKNSILITEKPKDNPFNGNLYILISGRTYSGGSEFASIAKTYSNAVFIGEETGGGFYGQTSGNYINLFLSNSDIQIRIPLLKFVTIFKSKNIPFGRGVIPDYHIERTYKEYTKSIDTQLEFALKLIKKKQ